MSLSSKTNRAKKVAAPTLSIEALGDQFRAFASRGKLEEASDLLESYFPTTKNECRAKEHYRAQLLMQAGKHELARDLLLAAQEKYGSYIRILSDLITCDLYLRNTLEWRRNLEKIERLFQEHRGTLSLDSYYRVVLRLGKFEEFDGRLSPALKHYEQLLEKYPFEQSPYEYLKALTQVLRVKSAQGIRAGLGTHYNRLVELSENQTDLDLHIEMQHALILAEAVLISLPVGVARMSKLFQDSRVMPYDRKHIYFDVLDLSAVYSLDPRIVLSQIPPESRPEPTNLVENLLCDLLVGPSRISCDEVVSRSSELTQAWFLRLLTLLIVKGDPAQQEALQRQLLLCLDGLDPQSQNLWFARVGDNFSSATAIDIQVNFFRKTLERAGKTINLGKKKVLWRFVVLLVEHPVSDLESITRRLWECDYNPTYFHRIRMLVYDMDRVLSELTAIKKQLFISKERVTLQARVRLFRREEAFPAPGAREDLP